MLFRSLWVQFWGRKVNIFQSQKITKCREFKSDKESGSTTVIIWSKAGMESTQLDTGSGERGSTGEATKATGT
jgi:hypothetical protein